jgi:UDP-3-O-[3-hydroxymyristoyl] glucosamine N-acyltransferase
MPSVSLGEIVDYVGGRFDGSRAQSVIGIAPLAQATSEELSFLANPKYQAQLDATAAGAILVPANLEGADPRWIRVEDPYFAMARVATRWFARRPMPAGISAQAVIASSAKLGANVAIGPFVTIGEDVVIGDGVVIFQNVSIEAGSAIGHKTIIYPNVVIYDGTRVGDRCIIHANVVIGSDGYGFATHKGKHHKIPQTGIVRIEDDVEIGAGTTIDRATFGETVIGEGTKIDNLVQIGHNVRIGKHCLLVSQVGIAGSTELGDSVFVAGQSGFSGHLKIGNNVQVGAKSAVLADVADGMKVMGSPAIPFRDFARRQAAVKRLVPKKK